MARKVTTRKKTGFDAYFARQLKNPEFAKEYASAREETDAVDAIVRALDARREAESITKAELAKRVGMKPEVLRRLFTAIGPNPTLDTVVRLSVALGCELRLSPLASSRARTVRVRR